MSASRPGWIFTSRRWGRRSWPRWFFTDFAGAMDAGVFESAELIGERAPLAEELRVATVCAYLPSALGLDLDRDRAPDAFLARVRGLSEPSVAVAVADLREALLAGGDSLYRKADDHLSVGDTGSRPRPCSNRSRRPRPPARSQAAVLGRNPPVPRDAGRPRRLPESPGSGPSSLTCAVD